MFKLTRWVRTPAATSFAFALACAGQTFAAESAAEPASDRPAWILHLASAHSAPGYDNRNLGLAHRWRNGIVLGAFHNSYGRTSAYGGWLWNLDDLGRWSVFLGAATGYGETGERLPVAPVVAPSFRASLTHDLGLRLSWFMDPREGAAQVLHLSVEWTYR